MLPSKIVGDHCKRQQYRDEDLAHLVPHLAKHAAELQRLDGNATLDLWERVTCLPGRGGTDWVRVTVIGSSSQAKRSASSVPAQWGSAPSSFGLHGRM